MSDQRDITPMDDKEPRARTPHAPDRLAPPDGQAAPGEKDMSGYLSSRELRPPK